MTLLWIFEPYQLILMVLVAELFLGMVCNLDLEVFNPRRNYKQWYKINWFGVWVTTIFLHIVFPLYAIIYWIYKLVTVGRK